MLEGCACEVRLMVDGVAGDLEGGISELRVTGGASRSDQFMQVHADILRRPLVLLRNRECTVLGASILGAVGCGYFASIHEAVQAMVAVDQTVEPDPATADIYGRLFEVFRFCYETAAKGGLYEAIYEFQRKYF
jgi:xylulokinase